MCVHFHGFCSEDLQELTDSIKTFTGFMWFPSVAHSFTVQTRQVMQELSICARLPPYTRLWNSLRIIISFLNFISSNIFFFISHV